MITLNDYLYNGDTVLKIIQKYSHDLKESSVITGNSIDMFHSNFLLQLEELLEHNDFLQLAHDSYSVRKISSRSVEQEKIDKIIEAGRIAPTAVNNQPFKLFVLKSPEALAKLDGAHHFPFVKSAPVVIIVGSKKDEAWVRPFDGLNYADIDASIAATQIMLAIHDQGLGSTW